MKAWPGSGRPVVGGESSLGTGCRRAGLAAGGRGALDRPRAQAASTAAPPSCTCGSPECVCRDQSGCGPGARKEHRGSGGVRLRPAAERGSRPLPEGQNFQRLRLPQARLRHVPGRGRVAPAKAPATCQAPALGHTYDEGPPSLCPHAPCPWDLWARLGGQLEVLAPGWESATGSSAPILRP